MLKEKIKNLTLIFLTISVFLCIINFRNDIASIVSKKESLEEISLLIDAGHGGQDGGAVSSNGVAEADINLGISQKTQLIASFIGIPSKLTRTDENSLNFSSENTLKENKNSDLKARVALAKEYRSADFVSIHLNKFSDRRYFGAQVFHKNDSSSVLLAQEIQKSLYIIDENNTREAKSVPNANYIMENIPNTGVIVECGFLSNEREEQLLQNADYHVKLAMSIVGGYTGYKYNR